MNSVGAVAADHATVCDPNAGLLANLAATDRVKIRPYRDHDPFDVLPVLRPEIRGEVRARRVIG